MTRGTRAMNDETAVRVEAQARQIVIASTFTADLLQRPLGFWMKSLDVSAEIVLAPYAQIMQELLDPHSSLSRNEHGFNVLLIRLEDWIRDKGADTVAGNLE